MERTGLRARILDPRRSGAGVEGSPPLGWQTPAVGDPIDDYLATLDEPKRSTLETLRATILARVPDAEPGLAYGVPAFKIGGKAVAGFAAYAHHLSYLPHSGAVLEGLRDELTGYQWSKGALKFPVDVPLPADLVARLLDARLREIAESGR